MEWIIALVSGSIGVILGFGLSIAHDYHKDFKTRKRMASAIKLEIANIFIIAKTSKLQEFVERGYRRDDFSTVHATFNYFVVFEDNANLITLLGSDLAGCLIEFYNHAKQIVDQYRVYGDLVRHDRPDEERRGAYEGIRTNWDRISDLRRQIDPEIQRIKRE